MREDIFDYEVLCTLTKLKILVSKIQASTFRGSYSWKLQRSSPPDMFLGSRVSTNDNLLLNGLTWEGLKYADKFGDSVPSCVVHWTYLVARAFVAWIINIETVLPPHCIGRVSSWFQPRGFSLQQGNSPKKKNTDGAFLRSSMFLQSPPMMSARSHQ